MKQVLLILILAAAMGCKKAGYNPNEMAHLTPTEQKIVGKWKLERVFGQNDTKEMQALVEMFDNMGGPVTMECLPDKTYSMVILQIPVTGTWAVEGINVRLQIQKVGDQRPEEIARIKSQTSGVSGFDMSTLQRQDFLKAYGNSAALDQAESLNLLQIGVTGKSLYVDRKNSNNFFSDIISVFKPSPEK